MANARQIMTRALRMLRVKGAGEALTPDEAEDALSAFQELYYDLIDVGCDLTDVRVSANYTAGENERVFNTSGSPITVTFPEEVEDTSLTPDSNGDQLRPPRDFSVISVAGSPRQTKVYDATLGAWTAVESLTLTATPPWSTQLGQGFAAMLAVLLAPEYLDAGRNVSDTIIALAADARSRIIGRMQESAGSVFFQPDRRWENLH